jgi:branched-chain amino acid aminotransferase
VQEQAESVVGFHNATAAFLASSTRRVQAIRAVDGVPFAAAPGPLTMRAAEVFDRRAAETVDP